MKYAALVFGLLLAPSLAFGAGFAKQSLFLSKSSVMQGDTVLIHAIVSNDTAIKFSGTLKLHDETGEIGGVPVSLAAGEASAISVSWKPATGSHTVTAELRDGSGALVEQESSTFQVAALPQPVAANQTAAAVDSSQNIQRAIANISPAAAQASQPVFAAIDAGRAKASDALDMGLNWAKTQIQTPGQVLSAQTQKNSTGTAQGIGGTLWVVMATLALYILSILQFVIGNSGIFYPALAILFFYLLWRLYRRSRRPAY